MCLSTIGGRKVFHEILLTVDVKVILERQWSRKKSYVKKWKQ